MIYRHAVRSTAGMIFCLLALLASEIALAAEPKRVMVLHSFGRDFKPWNEYAQTIRTELERQSPWPLDIIDHSLMTRAIERRRFADARLSSIFARSMRKKPLDLIVSIGAPAAAFVQRHRADLFPDTPMVFTAVDERRDAIFQSHRERCRRRGRIDYLQAMIRISCTCCRTPGTRGRGDRQFSH